MSGQRKLSISKSGTKERNRTGAIFAIVGRSGLRPLGQCGIRKSKDKSAIPLCVTNI